MREYKERAQTVLATQWVLPNKPELPTGYVFDESIRGEHSDRLYARIYKGTTLETLAYPNDVIVIGENGRVFTLREEEFNNKYEWNQ